MTMEDQLELQLKRLSQIDKYCYDEIVYLVINLLSKIESIDKLYKIIGILSLKEDNENDFK